MLQILVFSTFLGKLQRWNQAVDAGELCLRKSYSRKTSLGIREQSAVEKKGNTQKCIEFLWGLHF